MINNKEIRRNLVTYMVFLCIAGIGIWYANTFVDEYKFLRVWKVSNLILLLIGVPFLFFQVKAGLPDFWQTSVSNKNRFVIPLFIGMLFGILDILVFKVILHPEPYMELPPFAQPFPYSLFLYFSGAFEVEVFYRLIPLTFILLIGKWVRKGAYYNMFLIAGIILTALREPLEQLPDGNFLLILYSFVTGFLMNLIQAIWYRKAGFLASLSLRLGHYLLWHILLGLYIEYIEIV
jgi:hypothetical protein